MDRELCYQFSVANGKYYLHKAFSCLHSAVQKYTVVQVPEDADVKKLLAGIVASVMRINCQGKNK